MHASAVMVAAQRVADEDDVVARAVERAVSFVAKRETGQRLTAFERERLRVNEIVRHDDAHLAGSEEIGADYFRRIISHAGEITSSDE